MGTGGNETFQQKSIQKITERLKKEMLTIDRPAKMKERISELPIMRNGYGSVPKAVMDNACLKPVAKAIYAYLAAYANQNRIAYPSHKRIVSELHIGKESFYSNLRKLCDLGYVNIERLTIKSQVSKQEKL